MKRNRNNNYGLGKELVLDSNSFELRHQTNKRYFKSDEKIIFDHFCKKIFFESTYLYDSYEKFDVFPRDLFIEQRKFYLFESKYVNKVGYFYH